MNQQDVIYKYQIIESEWHVFETIFKFGVYYGALLWVHNKNWTSPSSKRWSYYHGLPKN